MASILNKYKNLKKTNLFPEERFNLLTEFPNLWKDNNSITKEIVSDYINNIKDISSRFGTTIVSNTV